DCTRRTPQLHAKGEKTTCSWGAWGESQDCTRKARKQRAPARQEPRLHAKNHHAPGFGGVRAKIAREEHHNCTRKARKRRAPGVRGVRAKIARERRENNVRLRGKSQDCTRKTTMLLASVGLEPRLHAKNTTIARERRENDVLLGCVGGEPRLHAKGEKTTCACAARAKIAREKPPCSWLRWG